MNHKLYRDLHDEINKLRTARERDLDLLIKKTDECNKQKLLIIELYSRLNKGHQAPMQVIKSSPLEVEKGGRYGY